MVKTKAVARLQICMGIVLAVALVTFCGCGSKGNVHGKVYYKDKALTNGVVAFVANKKTVGTSSIQGDGSYDMKSIPAGEVSITVTSSLKPPEKLPKELSDPDKSTEKYTVKTGDQEHDISLK
jgi:hypothetical protein